VDLTRKEQEKLLRKEFKKYGLIPVYSHDQKVNFTTECLLLDKNSMYSVVAFGLSILSPGKDTFSRREGRVRSGARALRAFKRESNSGLITGNRYPIGSLEYYRYDKLNTFHIWKSKYIPRLTSFQKKTVEDFLANIPIVETEL